MRIVVKAGPKEELKGERTVSGKADWRERVELVRETLRARHVAMSPGFPSESCLAALAEASAADIVSASLVCQGDGDFEDLVRS